MEKRSAAREIAFLACFQLPNKELKLAETDFDALCLSSLRTLRGNCEDNIKSAESFLLQVERKILEYQLNHKDNESEVEPKPVSLPNTEEFLEEINKCYEALNLLDESLQIPELFWHYKDEKTKSFSIELISKYHDHKEEAEAMIAKVSKKWDISRIRKVDKVILTMTIVEMNYFPIDNEVSMSEFLKIAAKYSYEESIKFFNGILASIIEEKLLTSSSSE